MSPLTILFHSAWQWGNQLATATYVALIVVMATGLVGRFLYGLVPLRRRGRANGWRSSARSCGRSVERVATPEPFSPIGRALAPLMLVARDARPAGVARQLSVARCRATPSRFRRALGRTRRLLAGPRAPIPAFRARLFRLPGCGSARATTGR